MKITFNKYTLLLAIGLLMAAILTGCKSKQNLTTTPTLQPAMHKVVSEALAATPHFHTADVSRMTIKLQMNNRSFSTQARCCLQRDSALQISILPLLGIEAFRAELTPATALIVDKMNKRYVQCQLDEITATTGLKIGYQELQSIICAQIFAIGEPNYFISWEKDIQVTTSDKVHNISFTCNGFKHHYRVNANGTHQLLSATFQKENTPYTLHVNYSTYQIFNKVMFPTNIIMNIQGGKQTAECTFTITKVQFDTPVTFSHTSLNRYTPITPQELLSK